MHCPYTGRKIISQLDFPSEEAINLSVLPARPTTKGETTMNERELRLECLKVASASNPVLVSAGKLAEEAKLLEGYILSGSHQQPCSTDDKG